MKKLAVTGLSGVIGKIFIKDTPKGFEIIDLYKNNKTQSEKIKKHVYFDLLNKESILKNLKIIKPNIILHMAAITHIDRCEMDKNLGKKGNAWKINVDATNEIAKYCKENNVLLVFLSTECVFDGKKSSYSETSKKNPINWYGFTKNEAEKKIIKSRAPAAIIRSVVAYHKNDENKTIYGKILQSLKNEKKIEVAGDRKFTPTHTKDIVKAINIIINKKDTGIYHIAPKRILTPFEFAQLIAKKHNIPIEKIIKLPLKTIYGTKRSKIRLLNSCLKGEITNEKLHFVPSNPENVI